jgi:hypothetical protein
MSTAVATKLDNPSFAGMYLYDASSSLTYHNLNIGGGAPGELFNIPTFFTQRVALSNGACLNLFTDFQTTQTGSICGNGAASLGSLLLKPLTDGGAFTLKTAGGTSLLYGDTSAELLSLDNGMAIAGFSDNGGTLTWSIASATGLLKLYNAGSNTITLTGVNGTAVFNGGVQSSPIGSTSPSTGAFTTLTGSTSILSTGAGGVGYAAGAGGTVTQATSRTTGVTLNKTAGAITLFSAAGSATPATFTVTDSAVAATDTINLSVQSSTNVYETFVTAVAAGSFKITVFTTGGTSTDAPVINFAIIKGATS